MHNAHTAHTTHTTHEHAVILTAMDLWCVQEGRETRAVTMCFTTFVLFQVVNAFNCRSEDKSIFKIGLSNNKFFSLAVGGSLLLQVTSAILLSPGPRPRCHLTSRASSWVCAVCVVCRVA